MCFLYRQSISIVYESKFKYIYRYFIKIDRCFCGILQSLPLRKCGLKCFNIVYSFGEASVTSLAEVWIEIVSSTLYLPCTWSLPLRKCGLKYVHGYYNFPWQYVTSLAEVWIEITATGRGYLYRAVTSLAEVWIEIEGNEETIQELKCHFPCGSVD